MDTPNGSSHTYITDYTYETEEGKCSGVASYEPVHAGEENPFKTDASFALTNRLSPDMPIYQEGPFGEMYFPSARVGYSRVVVSTPQPSLGTPTPTLNYAKGTGKMVHEFYTTRDFPTRVERSRLDRYYDPPLGATAFFSPWLNSGKPEINPGTCCGDQQYEWKTQGCLELPRRSGPASDRYGIRLPHLWQLRRNSRP